MDHLLSLLEKDLDELTLLKGYVENEEEDEKESEIENQEEDEIESEKEYQEED